LTAIAEFRFEAAFRDASDLHGLTPISIPAGTLATMHRWRAV